MQVGPFRLEVIEPMRRCRVLLEDNESGVACDLTFSARTAAIQEARCGPAPAGRWTPRASTSSAAGAAGSAAPTARSRSRKASATAPKTAPGCAQCGRARDRRPATQKGVFFLWAPLFWDDHVSHAIFFDGQRGEALVREGITAPLYPNEAAVRAVEDGLDKRMATARHRVAYHPGTRLARYAEIDLVDHDGSTRTISMEPILKFQMKGLGYGHPEWGQGMWKGELAIGHEAFDPLRVNPLEPWHLHTQQVVRSSDGRRRGIGVLEQICVGPYEPAGFADFLDGAKL